VLQAIPPAHFMTLAAILFVIGAAGVTLRRELMVVLMSIELMLNAVNITLVTVARALGDASGQIYVFFSLTVAAAEVAVGLALLVAIYRTVGRTEIDDISGLQG
jgi:NADH-quinone oxidoreductase subunit K